MNLVSELEDWGGVSYLHTVEADDDLASLIEVDGVEDAELPDVVAESPYLVVVPNRDVTHCGVPAGHGSLMWICGNHMTRLVPLFGCQLRSLAVRHKALLAIFMGVIQAGPAVVSAQGAVGCYRLSQDTSLCSFNFVNS